MNSDLIDAYRYHRFGKVSGISLSVPARRALELAREDGANSKRRYPSSLCNPYNPRFAAYGEKHMRWIESWQRAGLRFVGYADEIGERSISHKGWYTNEFQDEVYRGVVYQLPARNGEPVYVYGYDDPCNKGAALLSFDWTADKDNAARWADRIAERAAEEQREYSEISGARFRFDEAKSEASEIRKSALSAINEYKLEWQAMQRCPTLRKTLCATIQGYREEISELYEERAKLVADYGQHEAWNH